MVAKSIKPMTGGSQKRGFRRLGTGGNFGSFQAVMAMADDDTFWINEQSKLLTDDARM